MNKTAIEYIEKRFKEKFKEDKEEPVIKEDFEGFLDSLKDYNAKFVIYEHYNLPNFHYRLYDEDFDYEDMKEDYFSDCDGEEIITIYDVKKDKFVEG